MNDERFARWISGAGHPLVLTPLTVALVTRSWKWALLLAAATSIPLLLLLARGVRRGAFSDLDVSDRAQRPGLYRLGFPLLALTAGLLWMLDAPGPFLRGTAAFALLFAFGWGANRFLKTSLHLMFAGFCAVLLIQVYPTPAAILSACVLVFAVAWSRWRLTRHTPIEIAAGLILGIAAGLWTGA